MTAIVARKTAAGVEIMLHGPIMAGMAEPFARELRAAAGRPALIRMHSPGGDWLEAAAMFSAIERRDAPTTVLVEGLAASAASFLLQAATRRLAAENALLMLHLPTMLADGNAADHEAAARLLGTVRERLAAAYARSGQPPAVIDGWLAAETWFTAAEAEAAGMIDAIDKPAKLPGASFDLSQFTNPPPRLAAMLKGRPLMEEDQHAVDDLSLVCRAYKHAERLGLKNAVVDELLDGGCAAADVADRLIQVHTARFQEADSVHRVMPSGAGIFGVSRGSPRQLCDRMAGALVSRMTGREPDEASRPYRTLGLVDMARQLLSAAGVDTRFMGASDVADRILNTAKHTTDDFPNLLTSAGNRALLAAYEAAASPLKMVARRSEGPDFRPLTRLRFGGFPALAEVPESGEVTFGSSVEAAESYGLKTYGKNFPLSRQALINDDLQAFGDFARLAGRAVAEAEAKVLAALLALNSGGGPTMSDGDALFHANHGNLAASGTVIDVAALAAARLALRNQKGLDGETPIAATPRFLLVGSAKETQAEQVLATLAAATVDTTNPFSGRLTLLVEPRISGNAWYVFADPAQLPALEYAYLQGRTVPTLRTIEDPNVLGVTFQCYHDFGAGALDHRGAYRNPGA